MEADKWRLYCKGMASDDRRQGGDISDEVLEFVKPNIFERKMLKTKRPVKNRLLRNYTT
jgi:hypothetical protein